MNTRIFACLALAIAAASCGQADPFPPARPVAGAQRPTAIPAGKTPMTGSLPGDRVPGFQATVRRTEGGGAREERIDSLATKGTTLYIVTSTRCPYCNKFADAMKRVEAAYMPRGVDVVHVYPVRAEPAEEKIAWHAKMAFRGGQVLDSDASVARLLEAAKTPTAYVVDAKGVIVYRGAIEEESAGGAPTPCLAQALDALLAGQPVAVPSTEPAG
jgi:hypothetical protein